ncbi:class I tRNA ligase family protein, partial [Candidatus Saccharibacteria bacterium]|nr:class I tRNA ligase family protein [Candidatus Saccharibacteria bacterium]
HLLYVRFWCKFFADEGFLNFREPIKKLLYNGYINAPDGKKMSKSKGNVIDPLDVIDQGYGADTLRTYELFIGPYNMDAAWSTEAIGGVYRFLNRCWTLTFDKKLNKNDKNIAYRHKTIKKVTEDMFRSNFNTAVAALMEFVNELYKNGANKEDLVILAKLLKPFAPHLASEMLEELKADDIWPKWEEKHLVADEVEMVVQVNGKLRARIQIPAADAEDKDKLEKYARADKKVKSFTDGKEIVKVIAIPKTHLVNIVIK